MSQSGQNRIYGEGDELTDPSILLYRQIHPSEMQGGRIGANAFNPDINLLKDDALNPPTKSHNSMLSTSHSALISAEDDYRRHTVDFDLKSVGVAGISVGDCHSQEILDCYLNDNDGDPAYLKAIHDKCDHDAHVSIDYRNLANKGLKKRKARALRNKAVERGWQYKKFNRSSAS